jgi:hypothetical protein
MSRDIVFRGAVVVIMLVTTALRLSAEEPAGRREAAAAAMLSDKVDVGVLNAPLEHWLMRFAGRIDIPIRLDREALRRANVTSSTRFTASFKDVPVATVLREILRPFKLQARVVDGVIVVDNIKPSRDPGHSVANSHAAGLDQADRIRGDQARLKDWPRILRGFEQEAIQSLTPVLQAEIAFMRRICTPTTEQLQQLKRDRSKQLQEISRELRGDQFDFDDPWAELRPVARRVVQRKVATWVQFHLSPEQAARYKSEIHQRDAKLRNVCVRNLVSAIDCELLLTAEQREHLSADLDAHWRDRWTTPVVLAVTFPEVPDELILPHLDAVQRARWSKLPKTDSVSQGLPRDAFLGMNPVLDKND